MSNQILISRDGQQFGPYTIDEIQQHIATGGISPEDQAWIGGGQIEWQPLSALLGAEVLGAPSLATPPPPPPPASPVAGEVQPSKTKKGAKRTGLNQPVWDSELPRWRKVLNLTFIILIVVSVIAMYDQNAPAIKKELNMTMEERLKNAARPEIVTTQGATLEVSVASVVNAYQENPISADTAYKGRMVKMSGLVVDIRRNAFTDDPYITVGAHFKGLPNYELGRVVLDLRSASEASKLRQGQLILFQGNCQGEDIMKQVHLANVRILKIHDPHAEAREGIKKTLENLGN